jgi:phospholipid-binding lipoprotein MlaA
MLLIFNTAGDDPPVKRVEGFSRCGASPSGWTSRGIRSFVVLAALPTVRIFTLSVLSCCMSVLLRCQNAKFFACGQSRVICGGGMNHKSSLLAVLGVSLMMSACATKDPEAIAQNDPWEPTNRAVFDFDIKLDHAVARPVAEFYRDAVPEPAREGIHNALTNLNSPVVFSNDVLQGEGAKATDTFGRFMINSTVGVAGLVDVAARIGIPGHENDFGITLGKAGAAEGSYLVLPLLGPKPPRDLVGTGVDIAFDPLTYITWDNSGLYKTIRGGLGVLDSRASRLDAVDQIERSSIDFYATTRSLYRQDRAAKINTGKAPNADLPNF